MRNLSGLILSSFSELPRICLIITDFYSSNIGVFLTVKVAVQQSTMKYVCGSGGTSHIFGFTPPSFCPRMKNN